MYIIKGDVPLCYTSLFRGFNDAVMFWRAGLLTFICKDEAVATFVKEKIVTIQNSL